MQRIPSLDGLRAISISLVVLSHLIKWKHISLGLLGGYGALGVHIFFVLSGYLITNLLLREHERTSTISLRDADGAGNDFYPVVSRHQCHADPLHALRA